MNTIDELIAFAEVVAKRANDDIGLVQLSAIERKRLAIVIANAHSEGVARTSFPATGWPYPAATADARMHRADSFTLRRLLSRLAEALGSGCTGPEWNLTGDADRIVHVAVRTIRQQRRDRWWRRGAIAAIAMAAVLTFAFYSMAIVDVAVALLPGRAL